MNESQLPLFIGIIVFIVVLLGGMAVFFARYLKRREAMDQE